MAGRSRKPGVPPPGSALGRGFFVASAAALLLAFALAAARRGLSPYGGNGPAIPWREASPAEALGAGP